MFKAFPVVCGRVARAALLGAILVGLPTAASAQALSGGAAEADRARDLFRRGSEAFEAGRYEEARTAFLAAWLLKKHWQLALSLADSELRTGRPRDAAEHITFALRTGTAEMSAADAKGAREVLEKAKKSVAEILIAVSPSGSDISVDGAVIGSSPLTDPVFVEPGTRVVEVKRVGYLARREEKSVRAGESARLEITLAGEPGSAPPPIHSPPREGESGGKSVPLIIAGASLGAVGVGLGIGLLVASGSAASDRDKLVEGLPASNACAAGSTVPQCEDVDSLDGDAKTFGGAGAVSLAIGGTVAVATLVYALWPEGEPTSSARVMPYASPSGAGFSFSSSF